MNTIVANDRSTSIEIFMCPLSVSVILAVRMAMTVQEKLDTRARTSIHCSDRVWPFTWIFDKLSTIMADQVPGILWDMEVTRTRNQADGSNKSCFNPAFRGILS